MGQMLADVLARKKRARPQKSYMWRVVLPDITNTDHISSSSSRAVARAKSLVDTYAFDGGGIDMADINHRVMSINAPFLNIQMEQVNQHNTVWHRPTRNEISEFTMEVEDYEDALTFKYLDYWRKTIQNPDGTYNPPAFFKRRLILHRMAASSNLDLMTHIYSGCSLSAISELASDYESSTILRYNVTFTVDDVHTVISDISNISDEAERALLRKHIHFAGSDPADLRNFFEGEVVDDAYNVFDNVIARVPGL